ncbi:MAG: Cna B-type domain-containing protein [Hespellia sp.]|nr:Cna B-type domain-containing protein [Hespellia sp.]
MKKQLLKLGKGRRWLAALLAVVCLLSTLMSSTYAWQALASATNVFTGDKGNYQVQLVKLEKDIDGNETQAAIKGATFYLFHITDSTTEPNTVEQIGGIYTTDEEGQIKVGGLATGSYYFLEADPSYGYTYDKEALQGAEATDKVKYSFQVNTQTADSNDVIKVVAYNQKLSSSLTLGKTVVNCDGAELTTEQIQRDWTFTIVFSDGKQYPYSIDGGEEQNLTAEGQLTLKHGQTATFAKVPVGIHYEVIETATDAYMTSSSNSSGNVQIDPTANNIQFTNTYKPAKVGNLEITKQVTGGDVNDVQKEFAFTVNIGTDAEAVHDYKVYELNAEGTIDADAQPIKEGSVKNGEKITLLSGQRAIFSNLQVGTVYTVTEDDYSQEGYTTLTQNQTGAIIAGANSVNVVNQKTAVGNLMITKSVENADGTALTQEQADKDFAFTVVIGGKDYQFKLRAGESKTYENIPLGTKYTVVEDDYSSEGYITTATGSDGSISAGENQAAFTNTLTPEPEQGTLTIQKTVVNEDGTDLTGEQKDQEFTFQVQIGNEEIQTIKLKHGETYTFKDIPAGTFYSVVENDAYEKTGYIGSSTGATGNINGDATAAYTNTKGINKGDLAITKTILNADGSAVTDKQKEQAFTFAVTFSDKGSYTYRLDDGKEGTTDEEKKDYSLDKDGKLTLKAGYTATFTGIPAGVVYTVTEEAAEGYLQSITTQSGTIAAGAKATASFVNCQTVRDTKIKVKKVTTGEGADLNKKFDFTLTTNKGTDSEKSEKFSLANGEEKEFTLPYGTPYEVTEADYLSEGYIQVTVVDGSGTSKEDETNVTVTNKYLPNLVMRDIAVTKKWDVKDGTTLPDQITAYVMRGDQIAASAVITADDDWSYTFTGLPKFDKDGNEIAYTISEKDQSGYVSEVVQEKDGSYTIINTEVKETVQAAPTVEKKLTIEGQKPEKDSVFSFVLKGLNQAPMPEDAKNDVKTIHITGEGSGEFGDITYGNVGTYTYQIYEQNREENGYTYDAAVYNYIVTVTQDGGKLKAETSLIKVGDDTFNGETAVFTNSYNIELPQLIDISATKVWAGDANANQPTEVQVQLYQDGVASGEAVTLNADNQWTTNWTGLDKTSDWTLEEITELDANYTKSITSDRDENGNLAFTVTNTYNEPEKDDTAITVNKVWTGDAKYTGRPDNVSVQLYKNGAAYGEAITLGTSNSWTHTWANLEKSEDISWTVKENNVPTGYTAVITQNGDKGYTITNTYTSTGGGNGGGTTGGGSGSSSGSSSSTPQTSDNTMMWLWFALMIASVLALRFVVFYKDPMKN